MKNKHFMQRFASLFLVSCMICSAVPAQAAQMHNITIESGHYEIKVEGNKTQVADGDSFKFSVDIDDAYDKSDYDVFANSTELTADASGDYTVSNVKEDQTLSVKNLAINTYAVRFSLPDGSFVNKTGIAHGTVLNESDFPSVPAKPGYTVKWDSTSVTVDRDNIVITGVYVPVSNTYSITYDLNGGKWPSGVEVPGQYDGSKNITLPQPVKDGATFVGWVGTNITTPTKNVVFGAGSAGNRSYTAVWSNSSETFTVNFDMNGHGSQIGAISGVSYGSAITAPKAPTANGYTFGGWYLDKACTSPWNFISNLVTGNVTLYAKWTPNDGSGEKPDGGNKPGDGSHTETEMDGTIKIETETEVETDKNGVVTTIITETKTDIRTNISETTTTTRIEDKDNGITSIIVVKEDKNGKVTVTADSYITGFYEDEEDSDKTSITFENETGDDIKYLYMATSKSDLDKSKNLLSNVLKDGKSIKINVDLGKTNKWYICAKDADGDEIDTDYVNFDNARRCKSATILLDRDFEITKETEYSSGDDLFFEFDDDRTDAIYEQLRLVYKEAIGESRDAKVNATFYLAVEDAETTEAEIPSDMIEALADYTNGYVVFETLDCSLKFRTPVWVELSKEVSRELTLITSHDKSGVSVDLKDRNSSIDEISDFTIIFPYGKATTANTVGYVKGQEGPVAKSYTNKDNIVMPINGSCTVYAGENAQVFNDNNTVWSVNAIRFVSARGIFNGTAANTFSPTVSMNRAMIVTILYRLEGSPAVDAGSVSFTDVKADDWYAPALTWAKTNGIVDGVGDGRFDPNGLITREQLTKILFSYQEYLGMDTSARADMSEYSDIYDSPDWAKDAMSYAVASGLIYGNGENTLNPKGIVTREQMAVVMQRMIEGLN